MKKITGMILGTVAIVMVAFFTYSATSSERSCERQGGVWDVDICKSEMSPIPEPEQNTCPDGYLYDEILFKCVTSCEADLVYNGYTDSCTTESELKYHGYCDKGLTYSPSLHVCLGVDSSVKHTPLKDPPRTAPPEPDPRK